jgi:6-phosphogluconolactonase
MKPDVRILPDLTSLSRSVAYEIIALITRSSTASSKFSLVLAGGNTPRELYGVLAEDSGSKLNWNNVHLFWGDERYVPHDHPQSNYRMVRETLIDKIPIPTQNVHPMPTNYSDPEEAARIYEKDLRDYFRSQSAGFDLMILGVGTDGHTASIFPAPNALREYQRWVVPSSSRSEPKQRLTLTLPALSNAEQIFFMVSGLDKAQVMRDVLAGANKMNCPAAILLQTTKASVTCWLDEDAAGLL